MVIQSKNIFIALLRGINVGGNNIIKMVELKKCFEDLGFHNVITYIQSGNIIFESSDTDERILEKKIEEVLLKTFKKTIPVVVISKKILKETVYNAPPGFGKDPESYRYDVIFCKSPLRPSEAIKTITLKEGVDTVHAGQHVLYFSRLIKKITQSKISKIILLPIYQSMTIRNWNTTSKLLALIEKE